MGSIASVADPHKYVHAHFHFSVGYSGPHVVEVNLTADPTSRIDVTLEHEEHFDHHSEPIHEDQDEVGFSVCFVVLCV
jgi:hypothetical protein